MKHVVRTRKYFVDLNAQRGNRGRCPGEVFGRTAAATPPTPPQPLYPALHDRLPAWATPHSRDPLRPADLADPQLLLESRRALDELTDILDLGSGFYPFQRS